MIVITGAAGFIGSCLVSRLNTAGIADSILVDDFSNPQKNKNIEGKIYSSKIDRNDFVAWAEKHTSQITFIIHIGARTDTAEFNQDIFNTLNINYSKSLWSLCTKHGIPMVYASSAATYGSGEYGYSDDESLIKNLKPLNPYGESKNIFDKWVLQQQSTPPHWYGLKFFNVYGPNEYHKSRMASVIFHAFNQLKHTGSVKLFKSHKPEFKDGEQLRDFIYVKDILNIIEWLMLHKPANGIYNNGTGKARTFYDLAKYTAEAMGKPLKIDWIDIPEDIRDTYQYFTEAPMHKLIEAGYTKSFYSLDTGIHDYITNYLTSDIYY